MSSEFHEPREAIGAELIDVKRAIDSMKEELEAIDWYGQRAAAATDPALRDILRHHRREEIEHFVMLLEWLRRHSSEVEALLRKVLFVDGDIVATADEEPERRASSSVGSGDHATLGSLVEEKE